MGLVTVSDAAMRLGVSPRQVQHLVASGTLHQLARGVLDETSVQQLLAVRGGSHARAWSVATAWGAVGLLSGVTVSWMGHSQRSRLKARLRTLTAAGLVERSRGRAQVTRYAGHPSTVARLRGELVETASAAVGLGLVDAGSVDGYLATSEVSSTVARHGLRRDPAGRFTLRATQMDLAVVADLAARSVVLSALDLAESLDVRESRIGLDALDRALGRLHA